MSLSRALFTGLIFILSLGYASYAVADGPCSSPNIECVDAGLHEWHSTSYRHPGFYNNKEDLKDEMNAREEQIYAECLGDEDRNSCAFNVFAINGPASNRHTATDSKDYSLTFLRTSTVKHPPDTTTTGPHCCATISANILCPSDHPRIDYTQTDPGDSGLISCYQYYEYWAIISVKKTDKPTNICTLNPCNPSTGVKVQSETDYISPQDVTLNIKRSYNSRPPRPLNGNNQANNNLSTNWQNSASSSKMGKNSQRVAIEGPFNNRPNACSSGFYAMKNTAWGGALANTNAHPVYVGNNFESGSCTIVSQDQETITTITIIKQLKGMGAPEASQGSSSDYYEITLPDGSTYAFNEENGSWVNSDNPDLKFELINGNWVFTDANNNKSTYNDLGQIITYTQANGRETTYTYDLSINDGGDGNPDTLDRVTSDSGRSLYFHYTVQNDVPLLTTVTTPDGDINYTYNSNNNQTGVSYPDGISKTYHYEDTNYPNHLTGITDENGNRFATWTYDTNGKVKSSEHAVGVEKGTLTYNSNGSTTLHGALGDIVTYHFTLKRSNREVSYLTGDECRTCGNGFMKTRSYDSNGFLNGYTDWQGNETSFVNNARGLATQKTVAVGTPQERITTTTWHSTLNLPLTITEPQRQTDFTYNTAGQLLTRTETAGGVSRTTTYTYHPSGTNGAGKVATIDGPRTDVNDITSYAYNASDDLSSITNALGHVTQITSHDASGRPLSIIDANNVTTTLTWDLRGRLLSITEAGSTTSFSYDAVGQLTQVNSADGSYLAYQYDTAHRLIGISDNANNKISYVLDAMGNRTSTTIEDSGANISVSQTAIFDKLSRLKQNLGADSQKDYIIYDANHNPISSNDALNHKTRSNYDALDRLIKSIDPDNKETNFEYDAQDNLSKVTDAKGLETTYTYNGFDDLISQTSPDTGTTSYTYDKAGNRISMTDARGVTTTYSYDALNRLTAIVYTDTSLNITHNYDVGINGVGRLTQTTDASGTTSYAYDARGNLLSQTRNNNAGSHTISYSYSVADRLSGMIYPSGNSLQYQRAANGEITQINATINGTTQTIMSNASYQPFGSAQSFTFGNGLSYNSSFDQSGRLTSQTTTGVQGNIYTYNAVNNLISFNNSLDNALNQQFNYDVNDRLTDADGAYGNFDYVFDVVGNRTQKKEGTNTDNYSYASTSHHLQGITGSNTSNYQYDAVGNTTDNGTFQFVYADNNRLHQVMQGTIQIAAYTYNAQGQRTQKTTPSGTTLYHYNQSGKLIAETDDQGNTLNETYWFNGSPYALYTSASVSSSNTSNTLLTQTNLSGNVGDYIHASVVVPSGVSSLNIDLSNVTGDPELFVKLGSQASNSTYDCNSENGSGADEVCIINNPQAGTWHIAVYGYGNFSGVTLTAKTITGNAPTAGIPYITTPTTILAGSTQTFSWKGNGASNVNYWLEVGSSLGANNYFGQELGTLTSQTVTGLPTDGSPVFVRLYYNDNWDSVDFEYTASSTPASGIATITSPPNGASLTGATQNFSWDGNGASNVNYWLQVGSTLGGNDYYGEDLDTATNQTVTGLPTDGSTIYVRLYYNDTNWDYQDFSYVASNTSNAEVYYIHNNHLGTPETITDQNQSVVWKADYTPYGKTELSTETITSNIRFPGQYYDAETGLYYNYFRYYDPSIGRYVTSDPIGLAGGINTYGYVGGNPVGFVDPLGLTGISVPSGWPGVCTFCHNPIPGYTPGAPSVPPVPIIPSIPHTDNPPTTGEQCTTDNDKSSKCKMKFLREVHNDDRSGTFTCVYTNRGSIFTFPQDVGLACMPINYKICSVDTSKMGPKARAASGK